MKIFEFSLFTLYLFWLIFAKKKDTSYAKKDQVKNKACTKNA